MIDGSILAKLCIPEAPDVAATVSVTQLWQWTWSMIEGAPGGGDVIEKWATKEFENSGERRANYRLRSAVDALLTAGLKEGVFLLRVHDGRQLWRVPPDAFEGWLDGMDLEMTWAAGKLWQFDTPDRFRPLADLELPLLLTEREASAFQGKIEGQISLAQSSLSPPTVPEECIGAWIGEWTAKRFWPLREAALWVAARDLSEVARLQHSSRWAHCDQFGLAGATLAGIDVQGQASWRRIVEPDPCEALLSALRAGRLVAQGQFEGQGPMRTIQPVEWTQLEFGVPPQSQWDRSPAHKSAAKHVGQVHGVAWRGHWTGIVVDREELMARFPPLPVEVEEAPTPDQWLDALRAKARWSAAELTAWVGLRRWDLLAEIFGPEGPHFGALPIKDESRLRCVSECLEDRADAHDRNPRETVERAVQRGGLLACGVSTGGHATHSLEHLLRYQFWRDDVLAMFPELPATKPARSLISAETHCVEWLVSEMRASPTERPKPKRLYRLDAQSQIGDGLSERAFERAWRDAAIRTGATAWISGGRPRGKTPAA